MKSKLFAVLFSMLFAVAGLVAVTNVSAADQTTIVGPITRLTLAEDGKSAVAILKDNKSGEEVSLTITDDLTLDKFKDHRIVEGDEIRARYMKADPHISQSFKKTAGC